MHSEMMTIADELDRAMQAYRGTGISQAELSRISKVPQPTISRTLNGDSTPETATLMKLAKALGCTLGGHDGTLIDSDYPVVIPVVVGSSPISHPTSDAPSQSVPEISMAATVWDLWVFGFSG